MYNIKFLGGSIKEFKNLAGADLQGANFYRTNLQDANLVGADLRGAYFSEANLSGTESAQA